MGRNSQRERVPGGKELPVGRISWWEGITGVKDFLVGRNYRWGGFPGEWREGIPSVKNFPAERFPGGKEFPVVRISNPGWKDFPRTKFPCEKKDFAVARSSRPNY